MVVGVHRTHTLREGKKTHTNTQPTRSKSKRSSVSVIVQALAWGSSYSKIRTKAWQHSEANVRSRRLCQFSSVFSVSSVPRVSELIFEVKKVGFIRWLLGADRDAIFFCMKVLLFVTVENEAKISLRACVVFTEKIKITGVWKSIFGQESGQSVGKSLKKKV